MTRSNIPGAIGFQCMEQKKIRKISININEHLGLDIQTFHIPQTHRIGNRNSEKVK